MLVSRLARTSSAHLRLGLGLVATLLGALAAVSGRSAPSDVASAAPPARQEPSRGSSATPAAGADGAVAVDEAPRALATVVLVRHAEKRADDPRDPSLTEAGEQRAAALADLLGAAGVTHLFATEYKRTQETLAPLAARTGLTVTARPAKDLAGLVEALQALPADALAVVAGHSNTVPLIARALGVEPRDLVDSPAGKVLDEAVFDRVYVVTHARGVRPELLELRLPAR